jgi:hypothetical protein
MILNESGWYSSPGEELRNALRGGTFPFRLLSLPLDSELKRARILGLTAGSALPGDEEGAFLWLAGSRNATPSESQAASSENRPTRGVPTEKIFGEQGAAFLREHPEALSIWRYLAKTNLVQSHVSQPLPSRNSQGDIPLSQWHAQTRGLGALWTLSFLPNGKASFSLELPEGELVEPALSIVTEAAMEASSEEPLRLAMTAVENRLSSGIISYQSSPVSIVPVLEGILSRIHRDGPVDVNARTDDFRFHLPKVALHHQDQDRCLDVFVSYRYDHTALAGSYPDFLNLRRDISEALLSYPNRDDYWELVNHALVQLLFKRYRCLQNVAITLEVHPDSSVPFFRASTVAVSRRHLPPSHDEHLN